MADHPVPNQLSSQTARQSQGNVTKVLPGADRVTSEAK
jgi:hypothetical protein